MPGTYRLGVEFFVLVLTVVGTLSPCYQAAGQTKPLPMEDQRKDALYKEAQREKLYALLGRLPDRARPIGVELLSTEEKDGVIIEKLLLDINGKELVPAYFSNQKMHAVNCLWSCLTIPISESMR